MDTQTTALHSMAAMEAVIYTCEESDETRIVGRTIMAQCHEWPRPVVEFRGIAYEPSLSEELL